MFFGDDVIDGMQGQGDNLGDQVVFTALTGPVAHEAAPRRGDMGQAHRASLPCEFQGSFRLGDADQVFDILIP
jgi:hypothetical protein